MSALFSVVRCMTRFIVVSLLLWAGMSQPAFAEEPKTPIGPKWWPSEWGAGDQRGAANRVTPEKTLQGTKLIAATRGKTP